MKANEMGTTVYMLMYIFGHFPKVYEKTLEDLCEQSCQHAIGIFSTSVYLGVSLNGGTPNLHTPSADHF